MAGEHVLAAGTRNHRAQLRELQRAEERIAAADDPDSDVEPGHGQVAGDFARRAKDARTDRVSDRDREAEANAENREQPAAQRESASRASGRP